MATFTVSVSEELKLKLDQYPQINWAEYLKQKFEDRIKEFKKFEALKNMGKI